MLPLVLLWFFSKVAAFTKGSAAAGSLNADMTASAAMSSVNQVDEAIRGRRGLVDFSLRAKNGVRVYCALIKYISCTMGLTK